MRLIAGFLLVLTLTLAAPAIAQDFETLVAQLPDGEFEDTSRLVDQIAATGHPRAATVLEALSGGFLAAMREDGRMVILRGEGRTKTAYDAFTDEEIGEVGRRDTAAIGVNNGLRRDIAAAVGRMGLQNPDPTIRRAAALAAFDARNPSRIEALEAALAVEQVPEIAEIFAMARAAAILEFEDAGIDDRLAAVSIIGEMGGQDAIEVLRPLQDDPDIGAEVTREVERIQTVLAAWNAVQNIWFGISLGSVLLLAAIGLAITFGVMGVINMAHGELVMIGAYTTFVVQDIIRNSFPDLFDWSLLIAAPLAFCVAGLVGIAIERGIVRFLYGRPLETLLATWGVSLMLQQAVRTIFGPNNREVGNPSWMSGSTMIGEMSLTWNRIWIVGFSLVVFAGLLLLLRRTALGLQMRAVTQNRAMAAEMGIRTAWVDAMTFGLGAGIAGLAGVALSQITNVSPNVGQSYIVDSFMVVVFGGAGNLWGTLAGAFTLGILNKFLEPWAGAVLAKILILVGIILFIQKRPRGLFALTGRAVED